MRITTDLNRVTTPSTPDEAARASSPNPASRPQSLRNGWSTPIDELSEHQAHHLRLVLDLIGKVPTLNPETIRRSGEHHTEAFDN